VSFCSQKKRGRIKVAEGVADKARNAFVLKLGSLTSSLYLGTMLKKNFRDPSRPKMLTKTISRRR
jgi:hypothetical protein